MSSSSSSEESVVIFEEELVVSSGEEAPMSEWSSLRLMPLHKKKIIITHPDGYSLGSDDVCAKYIPMSDSAIAKHTLFQYASLNDNGIDEALNDPEPIIQFGSDGQEIYMTMCKEMSLAPIVIFYKGLLTSEIDLKYYGINVQGVRAMAAALHNNTYVKSLNLKGNVLNGDACYHIGQMLGSNTKLESLNLSGCRIRKMGLMRIFDQIQWNRALTKLNLSNNTLDEEGGVYLASIIQFKTSIKELILRKNSLGRLTALGFAEAIDSFHSLTKFDLSWNNLYQPPSTGKLLDRLAESVHLSELYLSWNALEGDRIASSIANILLNVPTISLIDLSNNRFQGEAISIIAESLGSAMKLHTLNVSSNPMTPADALLLLEILLLARVKIENLLMDNVWVDKSFIMTEQSVMKMKSRKNLKLTYAGVVQDYTINGPDPRDLLLKRADYLGNLNKKNPSDVGLFLLQVNKEQNKPFIVVKELTRLMRLNGIPLDNDLIEEFAEVFEGPRCGKAKSVNLKLLADHVQRMWPEKKLPTPPLEPVKIPEAEIPELEIPEVAIPEGEMAEGEMPEVAIPEVEIPEVIPEPKEDDLQKTT